MAKKRIEHGRKLYHKFVDFKKAFYREWHEGSYKAWVPNTDTPVICGIKRLNTNSAVLVNNKIRTSFNTSVGIRQ